MGGDFGHCLWHTTKNEHALGVFAGIALFNGVILNLHFPGALYKKLLDYPTTLRDLHDLMPDVAENLQRMLSYDEEGLEDIEVCFFAASRCQAHAPFIRCCSDCALLLRACLLLAALPFLCDRCRFMRY